VASDPRGEKRESSQRETGVVLAASFRLQSSIPPTVMFSPQEVTTAEGHLRNVRTESPFLKLQNERSNLPLQFIRQNRLAVKQYESFLGDYKELDEILVNLPQKIRHPIMVRVSNVVFFGPLVLFQLFLTLSASDTPT